MGMMPQWLAKTPEMYAFDQYFSMGSGPNAEAELVARYKQTLGKLGNNSDFWKANSLQMLHSQWRSVERVNRSIDGHFLGDWINNGYPAVKEGGLYWPQVPSQRVIDQLRAGVTIAIRLAMGRDELAGLARTAGGVADNEAKDLFRIAEANDVPTQGVLPSSCRGCASPQPVITTSRSMRCVDPQWSSS